MSSEFEVIVVIFCNLIVDNSRRKVYNRIIKNGYLEVAYEPRFV